MQAVATSNPARVGRPLRILVVDDDALGCSLMQAMLAPHGCQLEFAGDGKEALDAIETHPYDLVFMDLILPDINGLDVCRQVRARESGQRHLPIVAVTAYDVPGQPRELAMAGMDDYIFKPYDARALTRMIQLYAVGDGQPAPTAGQGQPVQVPAAPVFDVEGPLEDFAGDVDAYHSLLRDFLASLPARLERMKQAHSSANYETLGREAHSLKGIAAGLGAAALSRLAGQLNKSCAADGSTAAGALLVEVEQAMDAVRFEVEKFLASGATQSGAVS
jgi:CheY-like chemotaxis protein/HPt (histidine-containing phosphotransfer) domain-containing protein